MPLPRHVRRALSRHLAGALGLALGASLLLFVVAEAALWPRDGLESVRLAVSQPDFGPDQGLPISPVRADLIPEVLRDLGQTDTPASAGPSMAATPAASPTLDNGSLPQTPAGSAPATPSATGTAAPTATPAPSSVPAPTPTPTPGPLSPDPLYLRTAPSAAVPGDQTLGVEGTAPASMNFAGGKSFSWLSQSYPNGTTIAAGTYAFKLDWTNNTCGNTGAAQCTVATYLWWCNGACTSYAGLLASFVSTLTGSSGTSGSLTQTASGSSVTMSGCPCYLVLVVANSTQKPASGWSLLYNASVSNVNDTSLTTPRVS